MRIKQVVIHGFKTFAQKTEIVFDPGVTAVVGPNGSGKSNIVDAVRWCLGEQSFSLLRSKKSSDIIFAGSDKRARLGMAEVSLTLDNSGGELPIDFAEIELTRRAYRDGGNEYLLNGRRVRLLDITELLAQTGLGRRTYSLVGQGLIDKVLSLSPEERRSIFEEAAGITGYQAKRAKTLRQLEATQQNLTRVHDIIGELSPRLKYLRRQAERAETRTRLVDELSELLRQWYGYRWHAAGQEQAKAHADMQQKHAHVQQLQKELTAMDARVDEMREQQNTLRTRLHTLQQESSARRSRVETLQRELAVGEERLNQMEARRSETESELTALRRQIETVTEGLAAAEGSVEAAEKEHAQRQQAVHALEFELGKRQQEQQRLQTALHDARQRLDEVRTRQANTQSRLDGLAERRTQLHLEQSTQAKALQEAKEEAQIQAEKLAILEEEMAAEHQQVQALQAEIEGLEATATNLRTELQKAEAQRQAAERAADQLQTRFDLLQRLRHEGAGYASGVRAVLTAKNRPEGILGTVASLLRVPADLDKAIEIALGGAFQNIVTTDWDQAQRAIEFLKRSGRGRATFLPLDRLHPLPRIDAPRLDGIVGNAMDLVGYDAAVADVALSLLGRVWVADDLPASRRALDRHGGRGRPTVVTRGGEIVRPGGAVTGGRDSSRRDDSVLARERELRELPQQLQSAAERVEEIAARCQKLGDELNEGQRLLRESRQMLGDQNERAAAQQREVQELRRQVDRAQQAVRWHTERMEQLNTELSTLDRQESEFTETVHELTEQQRAADEQLQRVEAEASATGVSDLLHELADLRAAAAEAEGHLRGQRTERENLSRSLQSARAQAQDKEERMATLSGEASALATRLEEVRHAATTLDEEISGYQRQIEPAQAQLTALEEAQAQQEAQERRLQNEVREAERAWSEAQLRHSRAEDVLTATRHDFERDMEMLDPPEEPEEEATPPAKPSSQESTGEESKDAESSGEESSGQESSGEELDNEETASDEGTEAVLSAGEQLAQLPVIETLPEGLEAEVKRARGRLARVSNVNPDAPREYAEAAGRYDFMQREAEDLEAASENLRLIIAELDELMENELRSTFRAVAEQFGGYFQRLFNGGTARLILTEPEDLNNTGVEIIARPPGKRPQSLALLSGGERSLAACALIFSVLHVSPTPFCVLDEVDAALDESNVDRFRQVVESLTGNTQFIIVTHNRRTLEGANTIYGITMSNDGVSRTISLRLEGDTMVRTDGTGAGEPVRELNETVEM